MNVRLRRICSSSDRISAAGIPLRVVVTSSGAVLAPVSYISYVRHRFMLTRYISINGRQSPAGGAQDPVKGAPFALFPYPRVGRPGGLPAKESGALPANQHDRDHLLWVHGRIA